LSGDAKGRGGEGEEGGGGGEGGEGGNFDYGMLTGFCYPSMSKKFSSLAGFFEEIRKLWSINELVAAAVYEIFR
jgi:hypothetical protein